MLPSFPWPTTIGHPGSATLPWVKVFRWMYFVWRSISCQHPFITPLLPVIFNAPEEKCLTCDGEPLTKMSLAPILLKFGGRTTAFSMLSSKSMYCSFPIAMFQGYNLVHGKGYSKSAFSWQYCFCVEWRRRQRKVFKVLNGIVEMEDYNIFTWEYSFNHLY